MRTRARGGLIRHAEDWRAITSLNIYRSLISFGLVGLLLFGAAEGMFDVALPDTFRITSLLYLAQCALGLMAALSRKPALRVQVVVACAVDIAAFTALTLASTGVSGGLGMLLITPIAAAGMLLPARLAALFAACAAIGIIGQETWRALELPGQGAEFIQAGILGAVFFITAGVAHWLARRVRTSEALAAERASEVRDLATLNRHIIQQMDIGAVVVDSQRRVQLINDAAIRMLELEHRSHTDRALRRLSLALDRALSQWSEQNPAASEIIRAGSHALLPTFSTLGDNDQAGTLIFLEDALRQSEQAQQLKLISIGRLSASIAHEIRNPLGAISHAGQLLAESDALGADDQRMLAIIHRHTRRIDGIINSVLGLSRRSQTSRRTLALANWLDDAIDDYLTYNDDSPDFDVDTLDPQLQVEFDPDHLRQVLFNLWDNAQSYARRDGVVLTIHLSGQRNRSNRFCLDIRDNGPGIDTAIFNQIMEPFFTTTREGTGLGLHIAAELCEANGAQLLPVAHSAGACFRIVFAHVRAPASPARSASMPDNLHDFD
ncbi:signal transduction histidine kinase [Salinisphaera sp. T5B8]|uniref:sensor histidine kinase n=1 Tax=unclassified Salinisphaera TaxID=2649847 RepID=UPI0033405BCE